MIKSKTNGSIRELQNINANIAIFNSKLQFNLDKIIPFLALTFIKRLLIVIVRDKGSVSRNVRASARKGDTRIDLLEINFALFLKTFQYSDQILINHEIVYKPHQILYLFCDIN